MDNINPMDRKFWPKEPEIGFSPAHNKSVIERTIKKNDKLRERKIREYREQLRERTDAVASFLKKKSWGYGKPISKYLGRRNLAKLRAEDIITKIKNVKKQKKGS